MISASQFQNIGEGLWTSSVQCKSYLKANEGVLCAIFVQWMTESNSHELHPEAGETQDSPSKSSHRNYQSISRAAALASTLAAMISLQPIEIDLVPTLRPMSTSASRGHRSAFCFDLCEVPNSFLMPLVPSLEEVFCGDQSHCEACVKVSRAREERRGSRSGGSRSPEGKSPRRGMGSAGGGITQEQEEQCLTLAFSAGLLGNMPFLVHLMNGQPELAFDMASHAMTGACREGHPHIVSFLAEHPLYGGSRLGQLLEDRDNQGFNCVHYAAMRGSLPMLRELLVTCKVPGALRAGLDGATPLRNALEYAVACEALDCVELMLSYPIGEQFNDLDWAGALAVRNGPSSIPIFKLLRNHNGGDGLTTTTKEFLLILAAACGNEDAIKDLIRTGEQLNINIGEPGSNLTPLHYGCLNGHPNIVEHLIDFQCKVDMMDKYGNIAFHCAAANGNTWCVGHLLKAKSDFKCPNKKGQVVKTVAEMCGNDIIAMTLSAKK